MMGAAAVAVLAWMAQASAQTIPISDDGMFRPPPTVTPEDTNGDGMPDKWVTTTYARQLPGRPATPIGRTDEEDVDHDGDIDTRTHQEDHDRDGRPEYVNVDTMGHPDPSKRHRAIDHDSNSDGRPDWQRREFDRNGDGKGDTATTTEDRNADGRPDRKTLEVDTDHDGRVDTRRVFEDSDGDGRYDKRTSSFDLDGDGTLEPGTSEDWNETARWEKPLG